jgi:hypothetical protein
MTVAQELCRELSESLISVSSRERRESACLRRNFRIYLFGVVTARRERFHRWFHCFDSLIICGIQIAAKGLLKEKKSNERRRVRSEDA